MDVRVVGCLVLLLTTADATWAQAIKYEPLGTWVAPEQRAAARWDGRLAQEAGLSSARVPSETRPQLPGLRPTNVELMEDAILRKHPKLLRNSPERAGLVYRDKFNTNLGPLRGYTAEALFIARNPEWGYIKKTNASQYDVYRRIPGQPRGQVYGQIKYHDSGDPATYARDMIKDYRAQRMIIPDDHVGPTKTYLAREAERLRAAGDEVGARRALRNYARLRGGGFSSNEVRGVTIEVGQYLNREEQVRVRQIHAAANQRNAAYTALGAALAISLGPIVIDITRGDITPTDGVYPAARVGSLVGVGVGTSKLLAHNAGDTLLGTARGNIIVGTALAITDTTWLVADHGWAQAFRQASFYERTACSLAGLAAGFSVGKQATVSFAPIAGKWAPVIGLGATLAAGTAGCFAAHALTYQLIQVFRPEAHRQDERDAIQAAKDRLDVAIADSRTLD